VILDTKYTKRRLNDSTANGYPGLPVVLARLLQEGAVLQVQAQEDEALRRLRRLRLLCPGPRSRSAMPQPAGLRGS
jgi:hypothetical protein